MSKSKYPELLAESLLENAGALILVLDNSGRIELFSSAFEKLTGLSFSEVKNKFPWDVALPPEDTESVRKNAFEILSNKPEFMSGSYTNYWLTENNGRALIDWANTVVLDESGEIKNIVSIGIDATESRHNKEALERSEARLNEAQRIAKIGSWELDLVNNTLFWSDEIFNLFEIDKSEFGASYDAFINAIHPDDREMVNQAYTESLKNRSPYEIVHRLKMADGRIKIVRENCISYFDDDDKPLRSVGTVQDITESHNMEKELIQFIDTANAPIFGIDAEGNINEWNNKSAEITGFPTDEVLGKNLVKDFIDSDYHESVNEVLQKALQGIETSNYELPLHTKDNNLVTVLLNATTRRNAYGDIVGVLGVGQDITEWMLKDEQLRRTLKMDALGNLIGGIAHDYNNMMGIVLGYSELLRSQVEDNEKAVNYVTKIQTAGEKARDLTIKLMAFSRNNPSSKMVVSINKELGNQKALLEKTLTSKVHLNLDLDNNLWPVYLDPGDFNDAIINIAINANHAIKSTGTVNISTHNVHLNKQVAEQLELTEGDYVKVLFSDSGKGMDSQTVSKIFDPFFSTKGNKGTGLGLSQVYGFITRSDGAIKVQSEFNFGTELVLYFPRYEDTNSEQEIIESTNKNSSQPPHETILVVDDEEALCSIAKEILEDQGYHVLIALNGAQALDILKTESVDIVFSDVIMPEMTGYELATKISDKYPDIFIQLTSGYTGDGNLDSFDNTSTSDILKKPYTRTELLNKIRAFRNAPR